MFALCCVTKGKKRQGEARRGGHQTQGDANPGKQLYQYYVVLCDLDWDGRGGK